jgi:hypothetical protein
MGKFYIFGIFFLLSIFLVSCSEDTPLQPPAPAQKLSTFSAIQSQVFNASGCNASGCHSGNNPASNLDLSVGNAYNNLVEVTSVLVPSKRRVDRNNSSESVLVEILRGTVAPRMPLGGTPLSSATIDSIAKWIDEGALNN